MVWNNVREITDKVNALWDMPPVKMKEQARARYLKYFDENCRGSKELVTLAKERIPGGVQHNLALNYPHPLAIKKTDGAYMWDVDNNRYIDFLQAGGPTILGSNYKPVQEKVIQLIQECGPVTGLFHEYEYKLADLVHSYMPSVEMIRMLASGTEADMAAIRLARAHTGKKKVIKIGGAYHGWSDELVYDIRSDGSRDSYAWGIPEECYANTQACPVNDLNLLYDMLKRNQDLGGTACIVVEPIGPESGTRPVELDYNQNLRKLCDEFDTLLVFDEVVTGFRMGLGGAQEMFGVKPDLTVFGKALMGGYPSAGAVGGRKDILSHFAPGLDGSGRQVQVGGTLSANPLSCAAGYFALKEIAATNACEKAAEAGDRLCRGMQTLIDRYQLPFVVYNQKSIVHFDSVGNLSLCLRPDTIPSIMEKLPERTQMFKEMGMALTAEGLITIAASRIYTSLADTPDVIEEALGRFEHALQAYV